MEELEIEDALKNILAGNVDVEFTNTKTGNTFRYNIRMDRENRELWNVKPDINSGEVIGIIRSEYNRYDKDRTTFIFRNYRWEQKHVVFRAVFGRIVKKQIEPVIKIKYKKYE